MRVEGRDPRSRRVIGAAIEVHKALGPGLLESAYAACLAHELGERGVRVSREVPLPVVYKGRRMNVGYRMDLVVDDQLVVEVKSVESLGPIHRAQLLTYLRLSGLRTGLLLNFNVELLRDGIERFVL
jgi:GxxExxY protein